MNNKLTALVMFELFSTEVSGKTQAYCSGARPNHYISALNNCVIGQVNFENGICRLGETTFATIDYLYWPPFAELLKPGLIYEVREGARTVGRVEVLLVDNNHQSPTT